VRKVLSLLELDGDTGRATRLATELGLDPTDAEETTALSELAWVDRDYARIVELTRQVDSRGLTFIDRGLMLTRATALYELGDPSAAVVADSALASIEPELMREVELTSSRARAHSIAGRRDEALAEARKADEIIRRWDDHVFIPRNAFQVIAAYGRIGELEAGIDLLEELIERPASELSVTTMRLSPVLDPYRSDPRFDELVSRREVFEAEGVAWAEAGRPWLP